MATLGGAQALGLEEHIGSIEAGKAADLIALRIDEIEAQPLLDPIGHLVYAAQRTQVEHAWIDGQQRLRDRIPAGVSLSALSANALQWQERIHNANS